MSKAESFLRELETPMTYIERNGVYYEVPVWVKENLEVLEMLKTHFKVNGFDELIPNDYWYDLSFEERNKIYKEFGDEQ